MSPGPPVSLDGGGQLRHGYTMVSLHSLARRAVFGSRWQFIPFDEKHEIAWSAIAEELYSSTEQPRAHDLIRLGDYRPKTASSMSWPFGRYGHASAACTRSC
jgi:hypothetical protein